MSSYLNIYLKPKEVDKPLLFQSYSRSTDIYQYYRNELNPTFIGNDEEYNYSDLTPEKAKKVIDVCKEDIQTLKTKYNNKYEIVKGNLTSDLVEELVEIKEQYQDLEGVLSELKYIYNFVYDIWSDYSDFEKVLMNID